MKHELYVHVYIAETHTSSGTPGYTHIHWERGLAGNGGGLALHSGICV